MNERESTKQEPLLKNTPDALFVPRAVGVAPFGHRRNRSADTREAFSLDEIVLRKCSESAIVPAAANQSSVRLADEQTMSDPASFTKKKLSVARNVNLQPIAMPTAELVLRPTITLDHNGERVAPPISTSPLTHTLHFVDPATDSRHHKPSDVISIRIYLPNLLKEDEVEDDENVSGVQFDIQGGRAATAQYLLSLLAATYDIDNGIASEAFSLWMVSPLLEVQLKPHHLPFEVRRGWTTVLAKFASDIDEEKRDADEPILFLRRNVQLGLAREIEIVTFCPHTLEMLFLDARAALFSDRYPLSADDAAKVAGIGFAIEHGNNEALQHMEYIRKNLESQLPEYLADQISGPMVFGKTLSTSKLIEAVLTNWKRCFNGDYIDDAEMKRQYLSALRVSPPYGSAFFRGSIECPSISPLKDLKRFIHAFTSGEHDVEVRIGINRDCITVVDVSRQELLLVQKIGDCSWRKVVCTEDQSREGAEPLLLLHFPFAEGDEVSRKRIDRRGPTVRTNLLQVFGPQVILMDAMLTSMMTLRRVDDIEIKSAPSTVGSNSITRSASTVTSRESSPPSGRVALSRTPSITKCNRLCLASFEDGKCIKANGSLKKVDWRKMQASH